MPEHPGSRDTICMCMGGTADCVPPFGQSGGCSLSDDDPKPAERDDSGAGIPDPQAILDAAAKKAEAWDTTPPGPVVGLRGWHVMRGEGDGTALYFGRHRGAGYVALHLRGFSGWTSHPRWMPDGWEFFNPTVYYGRLFTDGRGGSRSTTVLIPYALVRRWRWLSPAYRRAMRDLPMEER